MADREDEFGPGPAGEICASGVERAGMADVYDWNRKGLVDGSVSG